MSKFGRKKGKDSPAINTSALPDIIFMLLFFFMVVTVLRDSTLMVDVTVPLATELTKLEEKSLVNYIYIGKPKKQYQSKRGTAPQIQLGDKFSTVDDIPLFLEKHRSNIPENKREKIISSLRVDKGVTMGIVADVKLKLRKSNQRKLNYSAKPKEKAE